MKILFLVYHGFSVHSGISKKILSQIKGLEDLGHKVFVCSYEVESDGSKVRKIDNNILENFGNSKWGAIMKEYRYNSIIRFANKNKIDFIYARSFHNANPFTIHLFKQFKKMNIKSVIEIPTYPYDQEYIGFPFKELFKLRIDKLFRYQLAKQTDNIVTFTDDIKIFGQRTIRISNGVDFDSIPLKLHQNDTTSEIHFIGVAEIHYWHGYDRFIQGLGEYYKNGGMQNLFFHIVGEISNSEMHDSTHAPGIYELIKKYNIKKQIIFHGQLFGSNLNELFEKCDFAIGSLARHRSGITKIKTLKNREYAARGIPFIYSETDNDFDNMPYIIKAPADESPIDIQSIIDFKKDFNLSPIQIRETIKDLSWKNQMKKVINTIFNDE